MTRNSADASQSTPVRCWGIVVRRATSSEGNEIASERP